MIRSEIAALLSSYAGAGNSFNQRLDMVRARLLPMGNWRGSKVPVSLNIFSDVFGNPIVTLPRQFNTILAGTFRPIYSNCGGRPIGNINGWGEYLRDGSGIVGNGCSDNFIEQNGRYCVFQDWSGSMQLRFKFETTESAGVILIRGMYSGEKVYSLYSGSWIEGEKVAFVGTANVTSTKFFDAENLSLLKPATNGRIFMYAIDGNGNEILVAVYEPGETVPRWRRYKVPRGTEATPVLATSVIPSQFFTKDELAALLDTDLSALFGDQGTITVSAAGSHDLVYAAYIMRTVRIVAQAGSGAYVHNFTLDNATVKQGGTLRIPLEVAASANITLNFYDNSTGGTLLQTVVGDSSNALYETHVFEYNGTVWNWLGREQ
jgi:hypothetical protein